MQKEIRAAALEKLIRHYEKCRCEIAALQHDLESGDEASQVQDIAEINAQMLESTDRWLQLAYARLEREHTRAAAGRTHTDAPLKGLRFAVQ
jgi:antirestriction protein